MPMMMPMRKKCLALFCLLSHLATLPLGHSLAWADPQPTNGTYTLTQDTISSAGGQTGGGNPLSVLSSSGQTVGGLVVNGTFSARIGYPAEIPPWPPGRRSINVQGTIDEPATVIVNGIPATITGTTFLAQGIQIVEGANTITATATDRAGNSRNHVITVYLDTEPPPMPTVETHLQVLPTNSPNSYQLSGTKVPGTSIWINGSEAVALNQATSWSALVTNLVEGDNILTIVAKDAAGNPSASTTVNIILDNLPPVISNVTYLDTEGNPLRLDPNSTPPNLPKTNFTPVTIRGEVDDSLTRVVINGNPDTTGYGRPFRIEVSLTSLGRNDLSLIAISPNNHRTDQTLAVLRGTIPTISAVAPPDRSKPYAEISTTIQITATDAENDPIEYQIRLDNQTLRDWAASPSHVWMPSLSLPRIHTLQARVRDPFGGDSSQQVQIYILRRPVPPPP